ncbi:glutamate-5-semialdehyde dehydrogenase [Sphaeroforma arctica JP610]|uniref:glutamate-5-semialdehyde dehydrogenase n=1 Tax=Sphaeroforma arctica JP610 TaxID=667725 RepID=A0A0L0FIA1_9EUKA|nr:glutamate-5-semialdehyde dehydrogenase [Sphaeroforma arctica JP610]KNC76512.1 glutamate-5-semialdehyde dehydrogenase [Sphaeroforma arctica JP610]|eukprot:XP_014150414.1 glutamate-5-semialdehyde dehydrogenase [Sphaeroforma arctica JP610]
MTATSQAVQDIEALARRSREASWALQMCTTEQKNDALESIKKILSERKEDIIAANKLDLENAKAAVEAGNLSSTLFKRLDLNGSDGAKYDTLLTGLDDVVTLEDPVGKCTLATRLDDGLDLFRVSCPVGVICIIFEARPECCIQISSLCLKSSNAVILKGGKEAYHSNQVLVNAVREGIKRVPGVPEDLVQLVSSREEVSALLEMDKYIDLVIPRGSNSLVKHVQNNTRIPVLGHADGICSVYLDESADLQKAISVVVDGKSSYPAACNATETLLVHENVADSLLPKVGEALAAAGVSMLACEKSLPLLSHTGKATAATEQAFYTEHLDLVIAVKIVSSFQDAVKHINEHGSHHTDGIVTESKERANLFMRLVDSAGVYHNASTRFADGFRYGFGAEIGVSTNRTHARGPVGLEGLMIYKYKMYGQGQASVEYGKEKNFMHSRIGETEYQSYQ